ncbi:MAG: PilZ domain-containing protein [Phycisphaerae bacterium]|nr:PilZ domain-containing protein [Phycisphaerae bacterium]
MSAGQNHHDGSQTERRAHRRLSIRLPVECRKESEDSRYLVRTVTQNVGSGGAYLELDSADFQPGDRLRLELTVPPAEGVSSYEGRATCAAEVLRVQAVSNGPRGSVRRYGVAARFLDRLRISY